MSRRGEKSAHKKCVESKIPFHVTHAPTGAAFQEFASLPCSIIVASILRHKPRLYPTTVNAQI